MLGIAVLVDMPWNVGDADRCGALSSDDPSVSGTLSATAAGLPAASVCIAL